jgi:hypothetical protein
VIAMPDENPALPVAGWYPDPENDGQDRWWDGANWSDHRRPTQGAQSAPAAPTAPVYAYVPAGTAEPYGSTASPYGPVTPADPGAQVQPYGAYGSYPAYGYQVRPPQNVAALVGFILALVGFVLGYFTYGLLALAGGIVSIVGLVKAAKMKKAGLPDHRYGMALTGVIVGFSSIVLTILALVLFIAVFIPAISEGPYSSY